MHGCFCAAETQSVKKKFPAASVGTGLPLNSIVSIKHMSEKVADIEEEPLTWLDGRGRMRKSSENLAHLRTSKHEQTSSKMKDIGCLQHEKVAIH